MTAQKRRIKSSGKTHGRKVRVGVFGAGRGWTMINVLSQHPDAELVAICDKYAPLMDRCKKLAKSTGSRITFYTDAEKFLQHDMDAVVLANYANEHAPYAVKALNNGMHVVSEVLAVQTLNQAVELVEAVERSKCVYSYAENYCYFRATQEMRRLYRKGDLGEFMHGEGEYVHNCVPIWPQIAYGDPTHWRNIIYSTFYCTHSLGPLLHITGERPVKVVGFETPNTAALECGVLSGAAGMEICQMSNGATVKSLHGLSLKREPSSVWYCIYGTKGMMESDRWGQLVDRVNIYIEGDKGTPFERSYLPSFQIETDVSRKVGGHSGSDFYTMHFFLEKILGRPAGENSIDVYTALDMTLPGLLAYKSILGGNKPYEVPDMRKKAVREKYRGDNFCTDPKVAGVQLAPNCSFGVPKIPKSVYERQRKLYEERRR